MTVGSPISPEMLLVLLLLVLLQLPGPRRLAHLAAHDPLTGLANRALFADRLDRARARREKRPGALLLLDLDGFKAVNDARGHPAGDRALVAVAECLRGCMRAVDTAARLGGDEFAIVLDGIDAAADARRAAGRIRAALAAPLRLDGGGGPLALGASIGLAVFTGRESAADLLRRADGAMYAAKRAGPMAPGDTVKGSGLRYEVVEPAAMMMAGCGTRRVAPLGRCATVAAALAELEADDREDRDAAARQLALWPEAGARPKHSAALLAAIERWRVRRRAEGAPPPPRRR